MSLRKLVDVQDARDCLEAAASSGMTRAEWARAHGIDARSLNAWRVNLERDRSTRVAPRLVELVPFEQRPRPSRYVVRVGDIGIEVDDDFDGDVLRRLIAVAGSC
jgi:transposase-like protein